MKLSTYAKKIGVTYRTAWNHWISGKIDGNQLTTGTIIINDDLGKLNNKNKVCIYARVSSSENKDNLDRQAERLIQYSTARGYQIIKVIKEIGSGVNDNRKQLNRILSNYEYGLLVIEHKDRLTRFGFNYLDILLKETGRQIEIVNNTNNNKEDLMQDFVSIVTSFCSRIYGLRRSKRKTEQLIKKLQND
jgi:predicted site-specific integrase-resolvase